MPPPPSDPRDYKLEIGGTDSASSQSSRDSAARPFLSIHFACCGVYCRIYRNSDGTAYVGRCPKCAKPVRFLVAEGGTDERYFVVE
jgi:hypothetical protein